jgi:hypothetical protein
LTRGSPSRFVLRKYASKRKRSLLLEQGRLTIPGKGFDAVTAMGALSGTVLVVFCSLWTRGALLAAPAQASIVDLLGPAAGLLGGVAWLLYAVERTYVRTVVSLSEQDLRVEKVFGLVWRRRAWPLDQLGMVAIRADDNEHVESWSLVIRQGATEIGLLDGEQREIVERLAEQLRRHLSPARVSRRPARLE